jgi:hypothetical protein
MARGQAISASEDDERQRVPSSESSGGAGGSEQLWESLEESDYQLAMALEGSEWDRSEGNSLERSEELERWRAEEEALGATTSVDHRRWEILPREALRLAFLRGSQRFEHQVSHASEHALRHRMTSVAVSRGFCFLL